MEQDKYAGIAKVYGALSKSDRISVLEFLTSGTTNLDFISEGIGITRSTMQRHLDALVEAGLINRREGSTKPCRYTVTPLGEAVCKSITNMDPYWETAYAQINYIKKLAETRDEFENLDTALPGKVNSIVKLPTSKQLESKEKDLYDTLIEPWKIVKKQD